MEEVKLYTSKEIMDHFRISRYALSRAIRSGKLKLHKKEGRNNYFTEEAIMDYLNSSKN